MSYSKFVVVTIIIYTNVRFGYTKVCSSRSQIHFSDFVCFMIPANKKLNKEIILKYNNNLKWLHEPFLIEQQPGCRTKSAPQSDLSCDILNCYNTEEHPEVSMETGNFNGTHYKRR